MSRYAERENSNYSAKIHKKTRQAKDDFTQEVTARK